MKRLIFAAILFAAFSVSAQNVEVNTQNFPAIQLKISSEKKLSKENVKLTQNGQALTFELIKQESQKNTPNDAAVYFLIETSGFTSNAIINNFKTGISDFVRKSPDGLLLNASSFWKANAESKILNNLSVDFTDKKEALIEEIKQKIKPVVDSQQQADVHKAIYDALDYINKTTPLPNKKLVVLTAGVNKSYSPIKIDDCIEKASQSGVQVFSLVYKTGYAYALDNLKKLSDKTQGKSLLISSSKEITDALDDFLKVNAEQPNSTSSYEITFTLPNPENAENVSISIEGQSQNLTITPPQNNKKEEEPKNNKQILFLVLGGIALVAIALIVYRKQKQAEKKREEEQKALKAQLEQQQQQFQQEQQRLQQQILQQKQTPTQVKEEPKKEEPQKFDPKKTYIGGGGGTPTLLVSGQGFQQNFLLHKPTMTLGRKEGNDIVIPIETVSSNHAILTNEGGNWFITDNNSTNGVILNGNRVQKHILKQGDKIQLGGALMVFQL
jgi:pSer/pThr/pTyr-binding forkhead associated (FHA) protein